MNKREKHVRAKKYRELIVGTQTQFDRLIDNLVSAQKNLMLAWHTEDTVKQFTYRAAADDYLLCALENVVNIRYGFISLARRYDKNRKDDKAKAHKLKRFMSEAGTGWTADAEMFFKDFMKMEE